MIEKPEAGTPTFRINMKKINVETALVAGGVAELQHIAALFAEHAKKAIDLRERQILGKVCDTILTRIAARQVETLKLAKKCKAVDILSDGPETKQ